MDVFWPTTIVVVTCAYLTICRLLRYRCRDAMLAAYPYRSSADPDNNIKSFAEMTTEHAYEIQKVLYLTEFPFTMEKALQFALFRTYGIPRISELLMKTKQFSEKKNAGKRYADTEVLIAEFMANPPTSERANSAISRMNYLHGLYQNKDPSLSLISPTDMLYTLSLFALEPARWVNRHEWRSLTPLETCALGTFWKSIGTAMNIDFSPLDAHSSPSGAGWNSSGLAFFAALDAWSAAYEAATMRPAPSNQRTADETTALLLYDVPGALQPAGRLVVSTLMDARLRSAMSYEQPPAWLERAVACGFAARKAVLRHAMPPRPRAWGKAKVAERAGPDGRVHSLAYQAEPWYIAATVGNRWGVWGWVRWVAGRPVPGKEWESEGFATREVGPRGLRGKGVGEWEVERERLMGLGRGGCPFG